MNQNYPNPFNFNTVISFQLSMASYVTLKVYDMLGQEVATLNSKELQAGNYSFKWDVSEVSSGFYFYRLTAGSSIETRRLVIVK
jgi:flagellar hook assembly protein FlgD